MVDTLLGHYSIVTFVSRHGTVVQKYLGQETVCTVACTTAALADYVEGFIGHLGVYGLHATGQVMEDIKSLEFTLCKFCKHFGLQIVDEVSCCYHDIRISKDRA